MTNVEEIVLLRDLFKRSKENDDWTTPSGLLRGFVYKDDGLEIYGVSDAAGSAIKDAVLVFRATHNLQEADWGVSVYGIVGGDALLVWITPPGQKTGASLMFYDLDAGIKVAGVLEESIAQSIPRRL